MERTPDGFPVVRLPVLLTAQEAARLVTRAQQAGLTRDDFLRAVVTQALFGATVPISPYCDMTPEEVAGEPDELPVEEDPEMMAAQWDAQHDHDLARFEERRRRVQQEVGGG